MDEITKQLNRLCANEAKGKVQVVIWLNPEVIELLLTKGKPFIDRLEEINAAPDVHTGAGVPTFEEWVRVPDNHRWFTNFVATETRKGVLLGEVSKQVRNKYFDEYPLVRPKEGRPQNEERYIATRLIERCVAKALDAVFQDLVDEAELRYRAKEKPRAAWGDDKKQAASGSTAVSEGRLSKVGT